VVVNYVAKTPNGKVFDNSLAKNAPYYIRVGSGAVIPVCNSAL
jgi:FKBP-type peptidyl-prolyl cis-trans isomerase